MTAMRLKTGKREDSSETAFVGSFVGPMPPWGVVAARASLIQLDRVEGLHTQVKYPSTYLRSSMVLYPRISRAARILHVTARRSSGRISSRSLSRKKKTFDISVFYFLKILYTLLRFWSTQQKFNEMFQRISSIKTEKLKIKLFEYIYRTKWKMEPKR